MKRLIAGLAGAVLLLSAVSAWSAVIVELGSGQRLEGVLRQANATRVMLDVGGEVLLLDAADVRAIYFASPETPSPSPAVAPPAPAAPPVEARMPGAAEALDAVKTLHDAADRDPSPAQYSQRVAEVTALLDRYLTASLETPAPAAEPLGEALRYYQLAEFALRNRSVTSSTVWLRRDDALGRCEQYQDFAGEMRAKGESFYNERTRSYLQISDDVLGVLWSCAADHLAEAEKAIPLPKTTVSKSDQARSETAKMEASKSGPPPREPAKAEPAKTEPVTVVPARPEPAKPEAANSDAAKTDGAKSDAAKSDAAKSDRAKSDTSKTEPVPGDPLTGDRR